MKKVKKAYIIAGIFILLLLFFIIIYSQTNNGYKVRGQINRVSFFWGTRTLTGTLDKISYSYTYKNKEYDGEKIVVRNRKQYTTSDSIVLLINRYFPSRHKVIGFIRPKYVQYTPNYFSMRFPLSNSMSVIGYIESIKYENNREIIHIIYSYMDGKCADSVKFKNRGNFPFESCDSLKLEVSNNFPEISQIEGFYVLQ